MKRELIAQIAHAINLAYCASLGDTSQPVWAEAPEWQQQSALAGVDMHLANPDATPEQSHESWLAQKLADGWVYGEVKDAEKKEHPCCVPYDELPPEQKAKDYLFRAVVHALKDIPDADDAVAIAVAELTAAGQAAPAALAVVTALPAGHVPVQYIGRRETFTDHLYGTGLVFAKGQARNLPGDLARKFLRHADQFKEGQAAAVAVEQISAAPADDTEAKLAAAKKAKDDEQKEQDQLNDLRQQIGVMTKDALYDYAFTRYQQKLDKRSSVDSLRQQVIGLVDQYGAV